MNLARIALLAFISFPQFVLAAATCTNGMSYTLTLPASVSAARDLAPGALLTNWVIAGTTGTDVTCTTTNNSWNGPAARTAATTNTGLNVSYGGATAPVLATNVPGVGIAAVWNEDMAGSVTGWMSVSSDGSWYGPRWSNGNITNWPYGAQVAVALVKTKDAVQAGRVPAGVAVQVGEYVDSGVLPNSITNFYTTAVQIVPLTCTTPDVAVRMGTHKTTEMAAVGALSEQPASFSLSFLDCPAAAPVAGTSAGIIQSVQYRIDPVNGLISGFSNVAALDGAGAKGLGIQLFDSNGAVLPYGTFKSVAGYRSSGGSFTVPLTARYYRTGTVTPGTANTVMILTALYQ